MKAILLSINPQHAYNILTGKKTLEIRKQIPKGFVGWVNLYCTTGKPYLYMNDINMQTNESFYTSNVKDNNDDIQYLLNGKVVARFWFDEYDVILNQGSRFIVENKDDAYTNKLARESCLDYVDLKRYLKDKNGYAWHIKNLEIFDEPKILMEFYEKNIVDKCGDYSKDDEETYRCYEERRIDSAPQSYKHVYVKEKE